mgnify:CR=1 FL=1
MLRVEIVSIVVICAVEYAPACLCCTRPLAEIRVAHSLNYLAMASEASGISAAVGSAPGKLILFGEHAVVHHRLAIASCLSDLRMFVRVVRPFGCAPVIPAGWQ